VPAGAVAHVDGAAADLQTTTSRQNGFFLCA
jgi:hypothetical protein